MGVALPGLKHRKLPSLSDMAFLKMKDEKTFGTESTTSSLSALEKKELNAWATLYQNDPRSLQKELNESIRNHDGYVQSSLQWGTQHIDDLLSSQKVRTGASPAYRFGDGPDMPLNVRNQPPSRARKWKDGVHGQTIDHVFKTDKSYIEWLLKDTARRGKHPFKWAFPEMTYLYLDLKGKPYLKMSNAGEAAWKEHVESVLASDDHDINDDPEALMDETRYTPTTEVEKKSGAMPEAQKAFFDKTIQVPGVLPDLS